MAPMTLKADLSRAKTRDVRPLLNGAARGVLPDLCRQVALIATECPAEWGAPDRAETYLGLPVYGADMKALVAWYKDLIRSDIPPLKAEFDFSKLTVAEFEIVMTQTRAINVDLCITLFQRTLVRCADVKDPQDADAYLDLPFYTVFRPLVSAMVTNNNEQVASFLSASAAG